MRPHYNWAWIENQAARTAEIWNACSRGFPSDGRRFEREEQSEREAAYDVALNSVEHELSCAAVTQTEQSARRARVIDAFGQFSARALDIETTAIEMLTRDFLPVGTTLAQWARRFDPTLRMADIVQACRNAWTACGLQPLIGERIGITPAILGYSLLYPYSDNYLDEQQVSAAVKLRFSGRFRRRLRGEPLTAADAREQAVWSLIELIENQFDRAKFPEVYNCLLSIHRAQEQSMRQLTARDNFCAPETLRLSCQKGGSSVLADACLAKGCLDEQQAAFAFEWGVLLQLGDDLQDVCEDLDRGSMTLFSYAAARGKPLDSLTIQLLSFAEHVGKQMDRLAEGSATLKSLLKMSWKSLIVRAVADSSEFFSSAFIREAERCSPFRFDFLRARQARIAAQHGLYGMMFEAFVGTPDEDLQSPNLFLEFPGAAQKQLAIDNSEARLF